MVEQTRIRYARQGASADAAIEVFSMRSPSPLPGLIFLIIFVAGLALAYANMSPESYPQASRSRS